MDCRIYKLAQVVRRDARCHTDSNTHLTVKEQVRQPSRKHNRLLLASIVIVTKVNSFFIKISKELVAGTAQSSFRITTRRSGVTIHRAKVTLPLYERISHHPVLCKSHHGVINTRVAMRVVFTHHVSRNTGRLVKLTTGAQALLAHRIKNSAVHRLQPITNVRKRTINNHTHRVTKEAILHHIFDSTMLQCL